MAAMHVPALAAITGMPTAVVLVAGGRKTLIVAATFGQPGTAATVLPNALQAGRGLVLALDRALAPGGQSGSRDNSGGPPQGPPERHDRKAPVPACQTRPEQ
jgi:hypothetical protein